MKTGWYLLIGLLLTLCIALPVRAQDDEDDDVISPELQIKIANNAWDQRAYDDAATYYSNFATQFPDHWSAPDSCWRTYLVYRDYRPNEKRRKATYASGIELCEKWKAKYAGKDKKRMAVAFWYQANLLVREVGRRPAIAALESIINDYLGTEFDDDAYWAAAEWCREENLCRDAIEYYRRYREINPNTETAALAMFREGWCHELLKDKASAAETYAQIFDAKYNWGHWWVATGTGDTARRLKAMGEQALAERYASAILKLVPAHFQDVHATAREILGQTALKMLIMPHLDDGYYTKTANIDAKSKPDFIRAVNIEFQQLYVSKERPFTGTLTITPLVELKQGADNLQVADGPEGKKQYTTTITSPDAEGKVAGTTWYRFQLEKSQAAAPSGTFVTRTFEKVGAGWGECTIRITSNERWHLWIDVPNDKTNVNNVSCTVLADNKRMQPNGVEEAGKTFRWYDWYDLRQGMVIKFPIEVGANVQKCLPRVRLWKGANQPYKDNHGAGTEAAYAMKEMTISLKSEKEFAYSVTFPSGVGVTLDQVME